MRTNINTSIEAFKEKGRDFASGEGKGVQMKKFKPYTDFVLKNLVNKADIINPEALLPTDGHPVIAITSHGPGAAWIPLVALVGKFFLDNGYGDIVGGMYPHKALFLIPGLKAYYRRVLGTPTDINSVEDIVTLLKNNDIGLAGTAPEGANCLLTFKDYVAPFRSKGMIAAAIKADASICLMAHQGAEDWNIRINLPFGWTVPRTNGVRGINITLPPYKKIDYMVLCRRYTPAITSADLDGKTKKEARRLLNIEIENIRIQLNLMTDEVKAMMEKKAQTPKKAQGQNINSWQLKQLQIQQAMFPLDEAYLGMN
jgi:hypothetical protein